MPRASTKEPKGSVLHQTIEIPASQPSQVFNDEPQRDARPDFWSYMHSLTPEQWKDHIVYLTREKPKTQMNGVVGGYLAKITDAFDIEDVKNAWGGYEFSYIMKRKNEIAYHGRFSVEAPPKIDSSRESVNAENGGPGNPNVSAIVQQVMNMLREELDRNRGTNGGGTTEKAVEMLSKASDKAMEVILKQVPEIGKSTTGSGNPLIDKLVSTAIERLLAPVPAFDMGKSLETMLTIFTKFDELRGSGGGGRRRDWKETAVEKGLEMLPQVLDSVRETSANNLQFATERARAAEHLRQAAHPSARPAGASVMTPRAPGGNPQTVAGPGLRTVPLERNPAPATEPTFEQEMPEQVVETIDRTSPAYMNTVKLCVVEMIQRGDHGEQIVDYLDGSKPGFSNTLVDYTPEQLTTFFRMDPILRGAVEMPNWLEVINEAREYLLRPDEGEKEPPRPTGKPN